MVDILLEVVVELLLMTFGFGVLALFVSSRLLNVPIPVLRLLAVAAVALLGAMSGDFLGSVLSLRRIPRRLLQEATQAIILAAAVVQATHISVAKAMAVAVVTGLVRLLVLLFAELLWVLFVFGWT